MERGVVPEMDAPSHQFALIAKENDVDDSPHGIRNTTKEKRKELDWVISELGYDQASFKVLPPVPLVISPCHDTIREMVAA